MLKERTNKPLEEIEEKNLILMMEDCQERIVNHMSSGEFNEEYVRKQRQMIFDINDQLMKLREE